MKVYADEQQTEEFQIKVVELRYEVASILCSSAAMPPGYVDIWNYLFLNDYAWPQDPMVGPVNNNPGDYVLSPADCTGRVVITPVFDAKQGMFMTPEEPYVATDPTEAARSVTFGASKLDEIFVEFRLEASFPDNPAVTTPQILVEAPADLTV